MKISDYTYEEKQNALDKAWEVMNAETDEEKLERIKDTHRRRVRLSTESIDYLIERAEEAKIFEGMADISSGTINKLADHVEKQHDQLNYVKKLVESNRVAHKVKYDLQLMFREGKE